MDNGQIGQYASGAYYNISTEVQKQTEGASVQKTAVQDAVLIQKNTGEGLTAETSANIDKTLKNFIADALKAAGLPQNDRTMQLVQALLDRQQPVDKNTLIMYNRLLGQNPGVNPETIIAMQKNGFSITKESIVQFENYQNNENQLFKNISDATDNLGSVVKNLFNEDSGKAVDLLNGLAKFVKDMGQPVSEGTRTETVLQTKESVDNTVNLGSDKPADILKEIHPDNKGMDLPLTGNVGRALVEASEGNMTNAYVTETVQAADKADKSFVEALVKEYEEYLPNDTREQLSTGNLFEKLSNILETLPKEKAAEFAAKLDTKEFANLAKEVFREVIFFEPEEAADKEKLTEYYKKLEASTGEFLNLTKGLGNTVADSAVAKAFNNVSDNVAFMNQVNEFMPYVQIPLKLIKEEAHGEFYVMKRRKSQQHSDTLTAFLRLNMEHLGELDIMVKLKGRALDVDIKAEKKDVVDFIDNSLDILEERLKEKGYVPVTKVGEKEKAFDFEKDFLEAESNDGTIGRYSFDMKI